VCLIIYKPEDAISTKGFLYRTCLKYFYVYNEYES